MLSLEKRIIFHGSPTTTQERKMLMEAGFIHITGLSFGHFREVGASHLVGDNLTPSIHYGKYGWDPKVGLEVIITWSGEVWLRAKNAKEDKQRTITLKQHFCPEGDGAPVFFTGSESVNIHDLLARMVDPDYGLIYEP